MKAPRLTFFVELSTEPLAALFERPEVMAFLAAGGHGVSLAMLDFTTERARIVRELESASIPVTAWLLLPREQGYWLTADNAEAALARYRALDDFARTHGLRLSSIGLDIEAPRDHVDALLARPFSQLVKRFVRRRSHAHVREAEARYAALVHEIQRHGRAVESYQFPLVIDERRAGSTLLRRTFGLVHVPAEREVLMCYRSFFGRALAQSYARDADAIAVGVTGGGVNAERPDLEPSIDFDALAEDLQGAHAREKPLYVFSLEGCVQNDMLGRLAALDFAAAPKRIARIRSLLASWMRAGLRLLCRLEATWQPRRRP